MASERREVAARRGPRGPPRRAHTASWPTGSRNASASTAAHAAGGRPARATRRAPRGSGAGPRRAPWVKRCRPRDGALEERGARRRRASSTLASWVAATRSNMPVPDAVDGFRERPVPEGRHGAEVGERLHHRQRRAGGERRAARAAASPRGTRASARAAEAPRGLERRRRPARGRRRGRGDRRTDRRRATIIRVTPPYERISGRRRPWPERSGAARVCTGPAKSKRPRKAKPMT